MIICFECDAEVKEQLDTLLVSGGYRDYGDVIAAALSNLLLITKEVTENGSVVIQRAAKCQKPRGGAYALPPGPPKSSDSATKSRPSVRKPTPTERGKKSSPPRSGSKDSNTWQIPAGNGVPGIFTLGALPGKAVKGLAGLPPDMWCKGQDVPLDRWVLGQYNRLLPAKVNARGLAWMFAQKRKAVELTEVVSVLSSEAVKLGDYLWELDKKLKTSRDQAFATAFPASGDDEDKARARYANQFVVYKNRKGELSGLMIALKLLSPARGGRRIIPTQVAWEFAMLPNPVLDGDIPQEGEKFSEEERTFLIRHILESVPVETFTYNSILRALRDGYNSPEKIDTALRASMADDRTKELSESYLASQRSGAISRMADLSLVKRERDGVRVYYSATAAGLAFLEECEAETGATE